MLTKREKQVLPLVAQGKTAREIGYALVISPRTVNRHLSNIYDKFNAQGRAEAVAYAIRSGIIQ